MQPLGLHRLLWKRIGQRKGIDVSQDPQLRNAKFELPTQIACLDLPLGWTVFGQRQRYI